MKKFWIIFAFLSLHLGIKAQDMNAVKNKYQHTIDSLVKAGTVPGIMVGFWDGKDKHFLSAGFADAENKLTWTSETLFEAGSITKTFTAFVLQKALDEKGIADTTSIIAFLPDSVQQNKSLEKITFNALMTHTSGLPRLPEGLQDGGLQPYKGFDESRLYVYLKSLDVSKLKVGEQEYSNLGAGLAGILAQRITGKAYAKLLEEDIFKNWKIGDYHAKGRPRAKGVFMMGQSAEYWDMDALAAAGGLVCTGEEMLNYLAYIAKPVNAKDASIIDELLKPGYKMSERLSIGKYWMILQRGDNVLYWHNGGTYGFSTMAVVSREKQKAVFIVVNEFNKNEVTDNQCMKLMFDLLKL